MLSLLLLFTLLLYAVFSSDATADNPYYGFKIGDFTTKAHSLSGKVYVVDARRIRIREFVYDGDGPAAFFWIGERGKNSANPSSDGRAIPNEQGSTAILKEYDKADIVLTLPVDVNISNIIWLAVWCKQFSVNFGEITFPTNLTVPSLASLGTFSTISNGVRSGFVTVQDSKTILVKGMNYDGKGTDVFFVAGNDTTLSNSNGLVKIPRVIGHLLPLPAFASVDVTLFLPQDLTVYNIRVISVYSFKTSQDFGHIQVSLGNSLVPPHITSPSNSDESR